MKKRLEIVMMWIEEMCKVDIRSSEAQIINAIAPAISCHKFDAGNVNNVMTHAC